MRGLLAAAVTTVLLGTACAAADAGPPTLRIGGIPDQQLALLEERFGGVAEVLEDRLGVPVEYRPATDYAALVTAFRNGDVLLAWFGGLTGVQARLAVEGAHAIVQRPRDAEFRSVFVAGAGVEADAVEDLAGRTFTFGSESSTSGHLMPRHVLRQAGVDPEADFAGPPSYSGSHDRTWKLVESGAFEAGALNEAVWRRAVEEGSVDTSRVRVVATTAPYVDYHWVAHPDLDAIYGAGFTDRVVQAFLGLSDDPDAAAVLDRFQTDMFVTADDHDYAAIEEIARELGLIE